MNEDEGFSIIGAADPEGKRGKTQETPEQDVFTGNDTGIPNPSIFGIRSPSIPNGSDRTERGRYSGAVSSGSTFGLEDTKALLSMTASGSVPASSVFLSTAEPDGQFSALESAPASPSDRMTQQAESEKTDEPSSLLDTFRDATWVVRIAASTTRRVADYSLRSGVRTGARMVRAAGSARSLEDFIAESQEIAYEEMERLGVDVGRENANRRRKKRFTEDSKAAAAELRQRGADLLEMSADVEYNETIHPAYPHILEQLAPDEARMLRYLVTKGPQPAVDVRDVGWFPVSSELIAAGKSMVGTAAGCRHEERTQAYLNNLKRLGLVWFSDEPVNDIRRYQLVEAQSHIKEAIDSCTRPKVIHRSIHLTPLGVDFCRVCLPVETIADDASSVYDPPPGHTDTNHKEPDDSEADGQAWSRDEDEGIGTSEGQELPEGVKNPHTESPWD